MVSWSVIAITSRPTRLAACSTNCTGVGQPSLALVWVWRSARPQRAIGVHPNPAGLTIQLLETPLSDYSCWRLGRGRLDAGLRALTAARAVACGAAAPEKGGGH